MACVSTLNSSGYFDYVYAHFYELNIEDFVVKSTMVIFFIFHFTRKQQKQQLAALASNFTQYTVLCAKTLIMACAYVGFFPVAVYSGLKKAYEWQE